MGISDLTAVTAEIATIASLSRNDGIYHNAGIYQDGACDLLRIDLIKNAAVGKMRFLRFLPATEDGIDREQL